jgi:CelD/BcsL family acetyltransferase involved in cellulose biosynthesis
MIFERIESAEEFHKLREEWNGLLQSSASNCVFLTHQWMSTWWKHLREARQLSILTARESGQLIGIMPLALRPPQYARMMPRLLEFIASGLIGSDYLDAIIQRGREGEVIRGFSGELSRRGMMLQFSQLRRHACVVSVLPEILRRDRWTAQETGINVCPFIDLTNHTWETYLGTLGSSQRYNFNRRLRALHKAFDVRLESIGSSNDAQRGLDVLMELHRKRWDCRGNSEAFPSSSTIEFHREFVRLAADSGWLRLYILALDDRPVAAIYGMRYGPTFYFYQSGFDPAFSKNSVGLVMMGLSIKAAIEEGASEYDLLHGDEEYKFHWAHDRRELGRLELYPPHRPGRFYKRAIDFNRAARRMARRVLKQG